MSGELTISELKEIACQAIDGKSQELKQLSQRIWENPELNFEEYKSHGFLTEFFREQKFDVTPSWTLDTAFLAKYGANEGPSVAVLCEYDALPTIGHACGHNLIAEAGAAAALGIQAALDKTNNKLGQLNVFGTPAEEGGGGKIKMIENNCFKDIDFSMMVHPTPHDAVYTGALCIKQVFITFRGVATHAAGFAWEGVNALDAAVIAYSSISVMRQQFKPTWRVHGVIHEGGVKPNIIPEMTKMEYFIRTPTTKDMDILEQKIVECFHSAARATGCSVELQWETSYKDINVNLKMSDLYKANAEQLGVQFKTKEEEKSLPVGSTDMGDVSYVVPSIHPFYSIGCTAPNHSHAFTAAAATDLAHAYTLIAAKSMAMTAIDVMSDPGTLNLVKQEFSQSLL